MTRNCNQCGDDFQSSGGARICSHCIKPVGKILRGSLGDVLSFRENQVVALVCQARLNKEIAFELHLTEGTIKEYLNRIYRKTGVSNRTGLAVWAMNRAA